MNITEIYENLCYNDPRNPNSSIRQDIENGWYEDDEIPVAGHPDCHCDNCFYGSHELAVEIIRLRRQQQSGVEYLMSIPGMLSGNGEE